MDHHAAAVDIGHLEARCFGSTQSGRICRGQRGTRLQARHRFEEAHNFIGPQHHRQLLRLTRIRDPLRQIRLPERYPVQKTKRADRLVQRRPRYPASNEMNLKGPDVLQTKLVRRAAEEAAELGNRMHIRSLGRRRQIADCHILDHAPTQRAHLGHRGLPFQGWGEAPKPWQTERLEHSATAHRFPPQRVSLDFSNERGASGLRI